MSNPVLTPQHKANIAALKQQGLCAEVSPDGLYFCIRDPHEDPHVWPGAPGIEKHVLQDDKSCSCGESFVNRPLYEYVDHALDALRTEVERLTEQMTDLSVRDGAS